MLISSHTWIQLLSCQIPVWNAYLHFLGVKHTTKSNLVNRLVTNCSTAYWNYFCVARRHLKALKALKHPGASIFAAANL